MKPLEQSPYCTIYKRNDSSLNRWRKIGFKGIVWRLRNLF